MDDLLVNNINENSDQYESSSFEVLEDSNEENLLRSYSSTWNLVTQNILDDNSDFACLKAKINLFIKDHPNIIEQMKISFSDHFIEHLLKRLFRQQFTTNDSQNTNLLFKRFFLEQDQNIRRIFHYFFDDIRLLMINEKFQSIPWSLRQAILCTPKAILLQLTITWLNFKGADLFTTIIYRNLLNPNPNSLEQQSFIESYRFNQKSVLMFVLIYLFVLFAVNISMIGTMVNCLAAFLLLLFIFYYSFTSFNLFNR